MSTNPFDAFPSEVRDDIDGLTYLGYLDDHFSFCGHDFAIRTLRGDEELLAGLVCKEFLDTMGQAKAYVWAQVALAVTAIDGAEDFCPQATPSRADYARARFRWFSQQWYWPVAYFIYAKYTDLLKRQQEALDALEDFCNGSLLTSTPFADSSTDKGSSDEEALEDIREFLEAQDSSTESS